MPHLSSKIHALCFSQQNCYFADRQDGWAVWCAWVLGLPPIFDDNRSCTELLRIFDFKMMKGTSAMVGAVSGVQPNGKLEGTCLQSGRF